MAADGLPIERACLVLGVSVSGYYSWLDRPLSARAVRHVWLTELITRIHADSRPRMGRVGSMRNSRWVTVSRLGTRPWRC